MYNYNMEKKMYNYNMEKRCIITIWKKCTITI